MKGYFNTLIKKLLKLKTEKVLMKQWKITSYCKRERSYLLHIILKNHKYSMLEINIQSRYKQLLGKTLLSLKLAKMNYFIKEKIFHKLQEDSLTGIKLLK